jgi:response regulator RpfG family c-di-GMP phosphodiesterase
MTQEATAPAPPFPKGKALSGLFEEDIKDLMQERVGVILLFGLLLVPLFSFLDWIIYPEFGLRFLLYRLGAAAICGLLYLFNRKAWAREISYLFAIIAFLGVGGAIELMILDLEGAASPYYAGLNLVLIGFCVTLPVGFRKAFLPAFLLYLLYVLPILALKERKDFGPFINNNFFLLATLFIITVASHFNQRLRFREFSLRMDILEKEEALKDYSENLEKKVAERTRELTLKTQLLEEKSGELERTQEVAILGLAKLAESRDIDTGRHLERIQSYTRLLADKITRVGKYASYIDEKYVKDLALSSILHDIGKVGVPDAILLKPGRLSFDEFEIIKTHTTIGGNSLSVADQKMGKESFLTLAKEIAYYHHERYDGNGYPNGLRGEEIPLSARLVTLADNYDALTSRRCYKEALPHEEVLDYIRKERGGLFDPDIVDAFLEVHEQFKAIRRTRRG